MDDREIVEKILTKQFAGGDFGDIPMAPDKEDVKKIVFSLCSYYKKKLIEKIPSVEEIKDIMAVNCQMYPADEYKMSEAIHSELMKRLKCQS